jgi:hypothetical protein
MAPFESQTTTSFTGTLTSGSTSCPIRSLAIAVPAAPAPLTTTVISRGSRPSTRAELTDDADLAAQLLVQNCGALVEICHR